MKIKLTLLFCWCLSSSHLLSTAQSVDDLLHTAIPLFDTQDKELTPEECVHEIYFAAASDEPDRIKTVCTECRGHFERAHEYAVKVKANPIAAARIIEERIARERTWAERYPQLFAAGVSISSVVITACIYAHFNAQFAQHVGNIFPW